jgi:hypothetical protein
LDDVAIVIVMGRLDHCEMKICIARLRFDNHSMSKFLNLTHGKSTRIPVL